MCRLKIFVISTIFFVVLLLSCDARVTGFQILPGKHNFGGIPLGDSAEVNFRIKNASSVVFIIQEFRFSGIASADYVVLPGVATPRSINPESFVTITVRFIPTVAGDRSVYLEIVHNGPGTKNRIFISASSYAVPRIEYQKDSHDFGLVLVNLTDEADFDISNVGTSNLTISSLIFTGAHVSEFNISAGGNLPVIIQPGSTATLTVQFAPLSDGTKNASLDIVHDAINETSPISFTLQGAAITHAAELTLNRTTPWDFGQVTTNRTSKQLLEITNTGITDLGVTSISISNGVVFNITSVVDSTGNPVYQPYTIIPTDKISAEIEFNPTSISNYNDTLVIVHDGINVGTPFNISLTGSGRTPVTRNFSYSGSAQTFTIPAGVFSLTVTANGAGGGGPTGGAGGKIIGEVSVTPGETYDVIIGGKGADATYNRSANGGGGFSGLLLAGAHIISAGGAGGCAGTGGSPYGSGGDGGGSNGGETGGNGGCGRGGAGGTVGNTPQGGAGGTSAGQPGQAGTNVKGGNGGNGCTDQASGGGGGGYGTSKGIGGTQHTVNGKGGDGGFGGGGGGGGGGWGSSNSRRSGGGGGGGGFRGGAGGTAPTGCGNSGGGGGGGAASYGATNVNVTTNTQGAGASVKQNGSLSINY